MRQSQELTITLLYILTRALCIHQPCPILRGELDRKKNIRACYIKKKHHLDI
jgi:hypothetical protein